MNDAYLFRRMHTLLLIIYFFSVCHLCLVCRVCRLSVARCDGIFHLFPAFYRYAYSTTSSDSVTFVQTQSELASDPTMRHLQRLEEGQAHSQAQVRSEHKRYEVCACVWPMTVLYVSVWVFLATSYLRFYDWVTSEYHCEFTSSISRPLHI